jgi:CRP-like cAMP-binding protein
MARNDAYLDYLAKVPLFSALGRKELRQVAALTFDSTAKAGDDVVKEGQPGHEFYLITEGTAAATLRGKKLVRLGPGDFFGEMALVDQGPRSATVTAETDLSILILGEREFSALMDTVPTVGKKILRGVAARLRSYQASPAA